MGILGIDFGASKIRAGFVHGAQIREKKVIATPKTKAETMKAFLKLIDSYEDKEAIGVGVAAFTRDGKTYGTPNMDFNNVDIKEILRLRYKIPVHVDNDANCAGLGELYYGHGIGKKNFVLLTLGTGIGGAVIIDGKLYRGTGFAGEPGHLIINNEYLESIASAPASVKAGRKLISKNITSFEIEKLADRGNKKAIKIYNEIGEYIGISLVNVAMILDPEVIILSGGFAKVRHLYPSIRKAFKKYDLIPRKIPIIHAKLSDDAGLIGAGALFRENRV